MDRIYCIGDRDTVSALSLGDIEGLVVDEAEASGVLQDLISRDNAALIIITAGCSLAAGDMVAKHNLEKGRPFICEIPGIHDEEGFRTSLLRYVTEALGVSL